MTHGIKAIKGFDADMKCRDFQFEAGKTYIHDGVVKACNSGFHSCPVEDGVPPHAVFEYYAPGASRYFDVTASGKTDRDGNKIASAQITIGVELTLGEIMARVAKWCAAKAKGKSINSGDYGAASNSGDYGAASNSGSRGAASNSGYGGAASNSGSRGAASNSGDYGAASNSGSRGAASNSGYGGAASNSGSRGAASNSGDYGAAMNAGYAGRVKGCKGSALFAVERDPSNYEILSVASGIVGQGKIKPGVWYVCKRGKLVEPAQ